MKPKRKGKATPRHKDDEPNLDDLPELNLDEVAAWIESVDWVEMGRLVDELLGLNTPQTKPQGHSKAITPTGRG